MKTLVLCVDRDDDIGQKTGLETPLIGKEENIRGAIALGTADPEDSDVNSIMAAISTYESMIKHGKDAEVATICGDMNVDYRSDEILVKELEEVLEVVQPDSVILVSDGAEDAFVFPMISSRIKVNHVKSVRVKQSQGIESLYYIIVKNLKDPKMRKKIVAPVIMFLLIFGTWGIIPFVAEIVNNGFSLDLFTSGNAMSFLFLVLAAYIIRRAYRFGEWFRGSWKQTKDSMYSGNMSLPLIIIGIVMVALGIIRGYQAAKNAVIDPFVSELLATSLLFMAEGLFWFAAAFIIMESREFVNALIRKEQPPSSFWVVAMSVVSLSFIFLSGLHYMEGTLELPNSPSNITVATEFLIGLIVALSGAFVQRASKREGISTKDSWRR